MTAGFAVLVAAVILGPMLRPGFPLRYDLVSVPRPVLGDDALGLGDRLPRAIPLDSATAVLSWILPDAWLTQFLALLALVLAGLGAARLTSAPLPGRLVAVLAAMWNPFVLEQLAIGHVPHLLGYAAVPWAGRAGWQLTSTRQGAGWSLRGSAGPEVSRSWAVLVLAAGLGSLTPGGGLLVALAALAGLAAGCWRGQDDRPDGRWKLVLAGLVPVALLQLPWLIAAAAHPGLAGSGADQDAGLTAFALRSETGWGRLVDAAGLGGMWNASALPASRGTVLARVSTVLVIALALAGLPRVRSLCRARPQLRPAVVAAALASLVCYLLAVLPILPGGEKVLSALVSAVPGAGLLRDGHRWLALPALGFAVLAGHAISLLADPARGRADAQRPDAAPRQAGPSGAEPVAGAGPAAGTDAATMVRRWSVAALTGCLLIAAMPDLAFGLGGRLQAWQYPAQWAQVRAQFDAAPDTARVLILPWQPFRTFAWSGGASAVLDPAPRLLPRQTIVSDSLTVSGRALPAEGPGARSITAAIGDNTLSDAELRSLAIGWVLIEKGTAGGLPALPGDWSRTADGPSLTVWRAPGELPAAPRPAMPRAIAVITAHLLAGGLLVLAAAVLAGQPLRRRRSLITQRDHARVAGST